MPNFMVSLEAARVNGRMSQAGLASALGVHRGTICNWESGKTSPTALHLKRISELTGVPVDYIFLPETLLKVDKGNAK